MLPYPRLALLADGFTESDRADRAVAAVRAGVRWVHLRDHSADPAAFRAAAKTLIPRLRAAADDVAVTVNTHVDVAAALGTGVHLGWRGTSVTEARTALGPEARIGYSAHEAVEVTAERQRAVDYYFFSPIFPTSSKPDHPGRGVGTLAAFCRTAGATPVLALGGITPDRVSSCRRAGAAGVAVLSGIMNASTPAASTRAYLRALEAPV